MEIAKKFGHIIDERDEDGMTALQLLSCNYSAFETVRKRGLLKRIYSSGMYDQVCLLEYYQHFTFLFTSSSHNMYVAFF
jgi:hypothetical protein